MENRLDLFNKTYDTLVTAWGEGELYHGNCHACAVGNICGRKDSWSRVFCTDPESPQERNFDAPGEWELMIGKESVWREGKELIASTGYTVEELASVEFTFERSIAHDYDNLRHTSEGQYIGLCAVMEVLWKIHGIQDKSLTTLNAVAEDKGVTTNA